MTGGGWTVIIAVEDDREAVYKSIDQQLTAAGFESSYSDFVEGVGSGAYSDSSYSVILNVNDDGSGQSTATYIVGPSATQ